MAKYQIMREAGLKGWAEAFSVKTLNNHVQLGWKGAGAPAGSTIAFHTFKKDEKGVAHKDEQVTVLTVNSDHSTTQ
jgi:peptidase E